VWFRRPTPGLDVSDPEVFTLEQFTIDGVDVAFERQADDVSQVYAVDLGEEVVRAGKPVVIAFRFRTTVSREGRSFHLGVDRPTKDLDIELIYDTQSVGQVSLMDFASRGEGGRVSEEPESGAIRYRYDGWLFPRAGLVFVWTLPDEDAAVQIVSADSPSTNQRRNRTQKRAPSTHGSARQTRVA